MLGKPAKRQQRGDRRIIGKRIADRYCIIGEIGKGGMGVVYKAIPFDDPSHQVAIKVIQRSGEMRPEDLMRFQKEASLMSQLHHPNIVVFHELGLFGQEDDGKAALGSGYYIVMEIADGKNLKESLREDGRKDLAYFFEVGIKVSDALDYTHGKNIIHRDIKPHNIVVGKPSREQNSGLNIKVLDFGVARLAEAMNTGRDGTSPKAFEEAAGTPLYMAPEQTPLMPDAPVDHRVDLYSLGCVLYELLAGKPPFEGPTREKLERQHVFAEPEPLRNLNPHVPPIVERIVHKLLAKYPKDRYQTAFSLHADLLRAVHLYKSSSRVDSINFALGMRDRFQAVSAQLALVGRDQELKTLVAEYDGVSTARGRSRLTLIKGVAGIGKSRLMQEFQNYLARRKVRFVAGSFSQHENALPFNAMANAFNEYLHRVLKSHPHEAVELRRRIKTTIGPMAHWIADIVPGLKPYLVEIPEDHDEDGVERRFDINTNPEDFSRFAKAFSDFTRCLGTDNQPVVFLFHDLHWADDRSLDLIDQFFSNANTLQFYLVISQRSGIAMMSERYLQFVEKFQKLRRRFTEVELERIDKDAICGIVGNMLSSPQSVSPELVTYLDERSKGNPMHLVALTRELVARDLIRPKGDRADWTSGEWEYDVKKLAKAEVRLKTIDLLLSRIQEYSEFDRHVLGIASTVGLTFQFEILLLEGRAQSVPMWNALKRAASEGIIIPAPEDQATRHLGRTFTFEHKKTRDAIYEGIDPATRRALHKAVGEKLEASVQSPTPTTLFALAHHFNSAMVEGRTDDQGLAQRALRYNGMAGYAAYRSNPQAAERYFENAWRIMEQWKDQISTLEERAKVQETLADLLALQRDPDRALSDYQELLRLPLRIDTHASIAYKTAYLQLVCGLVTDTNKLVAATLKKMKLVPPKAGVISSVSLAFSLFIDSLPFDAQRKRLHKVLKLAFHNKDKAEGRADRRFPVVRFYNIAAQLHLHEHLSLALAFHNRAVAEALSGRGSAEALIRTVAERAALLGYMGRTRIAYRFLDQAMDVAKACRLPSVYGYIALLRAVTIEYIQGRYEEINEHLEDVGRYVNPVEDRLTWGQYRLFKAFIALQRCDFSRLYRYCRDIPDIVRTRNWLSPRAMALMLFAYLLQGARDNIVAEGERYVKHRQARASRTHDLFIRIIHTLIAFAKGEIEKTREFYLVAMQDFTSGAQKSFLYPYEEDFIGLFAFAFPLLFEQEYGRHLMRLSEMQGLLIQLRRRVLAFKGPERPIPLLLVARANELTGRTKNIRKQYDQALKSCRSPDTLAVVFAYLWFGMHLFDRSSSQKRDYIRRALETARKHQLKALVDYILKLMEKREISFKDGADQIALAASKDRLESPHNQPSRLFLDHLIHVCEAADSEAMLIDDLEESFKMLTKNYQSTRIHCILVSEAEGGTRRVLYPGEPGDNVKEIVDYIEPYFNIRSTLFLPLADAPWVRGDDGALAKSSSSAQDGPAFGMHHPFEDSDGDKKGDVNIDTTFVMERPKAPPKAASARMQASVFGEGGQNPLEVRAQNEETEPAPKLRDQPMVDGRTQRSRTLVPQVAPNEAGEQRSSPPGGTLQMNALVPLRTNSGSLGVVFIEDIGSLRHRDTTYCRQELDVFGAQLGMLIERKSIYEVSSGASPRADAALSAIYQPASYTLERCQWLKVWHHGRLRTQRETSWFLGLNFGDGQYVMAYCLLNGNEAIRERLGAMLWHHFYVIRALAVSSGRNRVEVSDLRDEFASFLAAMPKAANLDHIALAFSVLSREEKRCMSGHFGGSRPYVVGAENVVQATNDVVLTYANGRDLRYWNVEAQLDGPHTYVLSYDTSKLDSAPIDTVQKRVAASMALAENAEELHHILGTLVAGENLPRYYLAAVLVEAAEGAEASFEMDEDALPPSLPKAQ